MSGNFHNKNKKIKRSPEIQAADRSHYWTLQDPLGADIFGFRDQGAAALLLIGMHLSDPRPWTAARNPVHLGAEEGYIDSATKRILGKRFRSEIQHELPRIELDPFELLLKATREAGHDFANERIVFPERKKEPGKLLARELKATAKVSTRGETYAFHARNFTEISQCLHAELTLLFAMSELFSKQAVDKLEAFELETTLKPCRMCAGFLQALRQKTRFFRVLYEKDDPGPLARNTLLDQYGYETL